MERVAHQDALDQPDSWFFAAKFYTCRDYRMFGILAGIRSSEINMLKPRGLPAKISWEVRDEVYLRVVDEDDELLNGEIRREDADRHGLSIINTGLDIPYVLNTEYHTHSWINLNELNTAIAMYTMHFGSPPDPDWAAIAAYMEAIDGGGYDTRIVFFFDS
jgi:hypothetical protein